MMNDLNGNQESMECAHELCACTVMSPLRAEAYCSDHCRAADDGSVEGEACGCGHPQCDTPR